MNLHCPTPDLQTPLIGVIKRGDPQILLILIEKNPVDLNDSLTYPCGRTVLMLAAFTSHVPELLQILLKKGANLHNKDIIGWTCLEYAIIGERLKSVAFLLDTGSNINQRDCDGRTPIMTCVCFSNVEILGHLLNRNADIDACDTRGLTALQLAILWRKRDAAVLLIERGADITVVTPLSNISLGKLCRTTMPRILRCIEESSV